MDTKLILAVSAAGLVSGLIGYAIGLYSQKWSAAAEMVRRRREWYEHIRLADDDSGDEFPAANLRHIVNDLTKPLP